MSSSGPPLRPSKVEVMRALLESAEARVHLDARRQGVRLPARLRSSGNVKLDYSYGFTPAIPDLSVEDDGIHATLSFGGVPTPTFVPWAAVFLIADFAGRGAVWREDLPVELAAEIELDVSPPDDARRTTDPDLGPVARRFTVVDDETPRADTSELGASTGADDEPPPPRPRPALRLVK